MPTVVEGVETGQQFHGLMKMGCDIFQGLYFSQPIPVAEHLTRFASSTSDAAPAENVSDSAGI